ncbi:MAG: NTP transferase domain-containing protein [Flavobacteriales bacterium]
MPELKPAAIILAAGAAKRMHYPKPWLRFDRDSSFLSKIIEAYNAFGCGEVIAILNEENSGARWNKELDKLPENTCVVINHQPAKGRFYSLQLGVRQLQNAEFCFIHNVDNPFINTGTLSPIYREKIAEGYASPVYKGSGGHPILIGKKIISDIHSATADNSNLRTFLKPYLCKNVKMRDDAVLRNINTREEYGKFFKQ